MYVRNRCVSLSKTSVFVMLFYVKREIIQVTASWGDFSVLCCVLVLRFNHELVFGVSVKNLNKAERLIFGDSLMTHAMVLTAVTDKVLNTQGTT